MNPSQDDQQQVNPKKLYLGNLPFSMGDEELRALCEEFGEVVDAKLITDFNTGRSKGFAFVEMADEDAAKAAIEGLNEKEIDGRTIYVKVARPKAPRSNSGGGGYNRGGRGGDRGGYNNRGGSGGYDRN